MHNSLIFSYCRTGQGADWRLDVRKARFRSRHDPQAAGALRPADRRVVKQPACAAQPGPAADVRAGGQQQTGGCQGLRAATDAHSTGTRDDT